MAFTLCVCDSLRPPASPVKLTRRLGAGLLSGRGPGPSRLHYRDSWGAAPVSGVQVPFVSCFVCLFWECAPPSWAFPATSCEGGGVAEDSILGGGSGPWPHAPSPGQPDLLSCPVSSSSARHGFVGVVFLSLSPLTLENLLVSSLLSTACLSSVGSIEVIFTCGVATSGLCHVPHS